MNQRQKKFLLELLSQPTAPFRELRVRSFLQTHLQRRGIDHFIDPVGNLVVGVGSEAAYRRLVNGRGRDPVRVFIAHMDHPGFHGTQWLGDKRMQVQWFGGSPVRHLSGASVWVSDDEGVLAEGILRKPKLHKSRRYLESAEVVFDATGFSRTETQANALFGGFGFRKPVWQSGHKLYTKAADDLVGVYTIMELAFRLCGKGGKSNPPFIGLLTRGEEVGFVGAIGHLELGWLRNAKRPVVAVSLEASRTLPGAIVGKGPVVRLGDWRTVFDADGMQLLSQLANRLLKGKHQRRLMDGGSCEATAATAWGLPTVGLSVPLGNYHNQGFEGGPDCRGPAGPAPEFVHVDDIDGMVKLCLGLMQSGLDWRDPWHDQRQRLSANKRHYRKHL